VYFNAFANRQCWRRHYVFGLSIRRVVRLFVRSDISRTPRKFW